MDKKIFCKLCGKKIEKGIVCSLTINTAKETVDEKNFVKVIVHLKCRNDLFDRIGKMNELDKKKLDKDLIEMAKGTNDPKI